MKQRWLDILKRVMVEPTASFREEAIVAVVKDWCKAGGFTCLEDKSGNLTIKYRRGRKKKGQEWVFTAHMDHPSFVVRRRRGKTLWADFRGGIHQDYFSGGPVRFFTENGDVLAKIKSAKRDKKLGWWCCTLELKKAVKIPAGTLGMWDVPVFKKQGDRLSARACDDLAGVAAIMCALEELKKEKINGHVTAILTRAEEVGFVGAVAACESRTLPKNGKIIAIETSAEQPGAKLGDGVVIRVGDRTWTFDPTLTAHVSKAAALLKKDDKKFNYKRMLMPGGTCESTAFCVFGYQATGLCLPLGNYHNMGPKKRIGPEKIHLGDYASLIKLLVSIPRLNSGPKELAAKLKSRLHDRLETRRSFL